MSFICLVQVVQGVLLFCLPFKKKSNRSCVLFLDGSTSALRLDHLDHLDQRLESSRFMIEHSDCGETVIFCDGLVAFSPWKQQRRQYYAMRSVT
jgi:hypothetical protein